MNQEIQKFENNQIVQREQFNFDINTANMLIQSGMFGPKYKKPEEMLAIVLMGKEQGLSPMQALTYGYNIQGKSDMEVKVRWAHVQKAKNPNGTNLLSKYIVKASGDESCTVILERTNNDGSKSSIEQTFTIEQAAKQGLTNKPNWKQIPAKMLYWRALGNAIDMLFPDVRIGLHENYSEVNERELPGSALLAASSQEEKDPWEQDQIIEVQAEPKITEAQRKRLFAIAKGPKREYAAWTDSQIKDFLKEAYSLDSSQDILMKDYEDICKVLAGPAFETDAPGQAKAFTDQIPE